MSILKEGLPFREVREVAEKNVDVQLAFDSLDETQRLILSLHAGIYGFGHHSRSEIAQILSDKLGEDITKGKARTLISQAGVALGRAMGGV